MTERFAQRQPAAPPVTIDSPIAALNSALPMLSLSATVELAWLIEGARRIVRLTCGAMQANALVRGVASRGLAAHVWEKRLRPFVHPGLAGYAMGGAVTEAAGTPDELAVVFVARDLADARAAASAQTTLDDETIGAALDYPACCVAGYVANRAAFSRGFAPLFDRRAGPWPWWSNVLLSSFGYLAVSHLPCAPDCKETGMRVAGHWSALKRFDAPFASFVQSRLSSLVVWHPQLGIAAMTTTTSGHWTASAGMRPYVVDGSLVLDPAAARDAQWIDHRGAA